jgi:DNA polymerase III sliding clamp (beta) subunit (PCNA family)
MELTARAGNLAHALAHVRRGVVARSDIPISNTTLITAAVDGATIVTHALNTTHTARCETMGDFIPGAVAVPAGKLAALLEAMPADATVTIASDGPAATVATGRSRYRLPALSPGDFPDPLTPSDDVTAVTLTADDVSAMHLISILRHPSRSPLIVE